MSRRRATSLSLALSFALAAACGGSTSSTSGGAASSDGGDGAVPPTASCSDLASAAQKNVSAVVDAHRACTKESDCTTISLSASCFDSCTRSIRKDAAAAFKSAQDQADAMQCAQFKSQGCTVTIPPCEPPLSTSCTDGLCTGG